MEHSGFPLALRAHISFLFISCERGFVMRCSAALLWVVSSVVALPALAQSSWPVMKQERKELDTSFERLWKEPLVWKLDELPIKGYVAKHRVPYAGAIYPDNMGGTWQGTWDQGYDGLVNRQERLQADGTKRQMEHVYVTVDEDTFKVKEYAVESDGWRASSPRGEITFKRRKDK